MSLDQVFTPNQPAPKATHVAIRNSVDGRVIVQFIALVNEQATAMMALEIEPKRIKCHSGRFTLVSKPLHARISSYEEGPYNPLVTAAYAVATLGVGAPIAKWYEYRFALNRKNELVVRRLQIDSGLLFLIYSRAAMADDWFVFATASPEIFPGQVE
jgi:hypothetical protein